MFQLAGKICDNSKCFDKKRLLIYESRLRNSRNCLLMQILLFLFIYFFLVFIVLLSLLYPDNIFCSQVAPLLHNLSIPAE